MSNSVQSYRSYVFSDTGRPQYGESCTYEKESRSGRVLRRRVKYTVSQWFLEPTFGDNAARFVALRAALASPEGVLRITDEHGTELVNRRVHVCDHALPEQWSASMSEVKVAFECWENISANIFDATFTPTGGAAITLPQVQDWNESIKADRWSFLVNERRESRQFIGASGIYRADPDALPAARLAAVQAAASALRQCDKKEGVLAYGDFSELMRVDSIELPQGDGSDALRWTLQASRLRFPAGNYAEAAYEVKRADNVQASERLTTVSGDIRAYDEAGAQDKRDAIAAVFATGRALLGSQFNKKAVDGTDGAEDAREWTFSLTYREVLPDAVASWTLTVSDRTDYATGLITTTYAGRVTAANTTLALALVAAKAAGKYPMPVSSEVSVGSLSSGGSDEQFTEVTFSYAYLRRGAERHAEVMSENSSENFGNVTVTVSGTAAADTAAHALAFARTFLPSGVLVSQRESEAQAYHGETPDSLFLKLSFTYVAQSAHSVTSLEYGVDTTEDFDAFTTTKTWSGMVRSANESVSNSAINTLISGAAGSRVRDQRKPSYRKEGSNLVYVGTEFNVSFVAALSAGGNDIISAQYSVDRSYSFQNTVVTPIPYSSPNVQTNTGVLPGGMVIQGTIVTVSETGGLSWARGLRSVAAGGHALQPREKIEVRFLPRSNSDVRCHALEFTYPYVFATLAMA